MTTTEGSQRPAEGIQKVETSNWEVTRVETPMTEPLFPSPNPRRVAAGRRNRLLRRGLSDEGRERLRDAALAKRPWEHSTGPRSVEGKAQAVVNGKVRQKGRRSVRELRQDLAPLREMLKTIQEQRRILSVEVTLCVAHES